MVIRQVCCFHSVYILETKAMLWRCGLDCQTGFSIRFYWDQYKTEAEKNGKEKMVKGKWNL